MPGHISRSFRDFVIFTTFQSIILWNVLGIKYCYRFFVFIQEDTLLGDKNIVNLMTIRSWLLITTLIICLMVTGVIANPPSDMQLSYDQQTKTLYVTIVHPVGGATDHYIKSVSITENGKSIIDKQYTTQQGDSVTYMYPLTISDGGQISVTATCSLFGSLTKDLKTGSAQAKTSTPGFTFAGAGIAVGLGMALILFGKR